MASATAAAVPGLSEDISSFLGYASLPESFRDALFHDGIKKIAHLQDVMEDDLEQYGTLVFKFIDRDLGIVLVNSSETNVLDIHDRMFKKCRLFFSFIIDRFQEDGTETVYSDERRYIICPEHSSCSKEDEPVSSFLNFADLTQYEAEFITDGVTDVGHIRDIKEEDCFSYGD